MEMFSFYWRYEMQLAGRSRLMSKLWFHHASLQLIWWGQPGGHHSVKSQRLGRKHICDLILSVIGRGEMTEWIHLKEEKRGGGIFKQKGYTWTDAIMDISKIVIVTMWTWVRSDMCCCLCLCFSCAKDMQHIVECNCYMHCHLQLSFKLHCSYWFGATVVTLWRGLLENLTKWAVPVGSTCNLKSPVGANKQIVQQSIAMVPLFPTQDFCTYWHIPVLI